MEWIITCQHCGAEFDSQDSLADSMAMWRDHMELRHPEKVED
jgi:hypothetical protein